jgi:hypothetical protein
MSTFANNQDLFAAYKAALVKDGASDSEAAEVVAKLEAELKMRSLRNPQRVTDNFSAIQLPHGDLLVLREVLGLSSAADTATKPSKEEGKKEKDDDKSSTAILSDKKVNQMTLRSLIEHYDPREANRVAERLREASHGHGFLVFKDEEKMIVDVDVSYQLLEEIRNSEQPRLHFTRDGGEVHEVFAVGIRPTKPLADVNPLFPGQFLRSDQSCTITDQKWTGVTPEVRVLYHLAVKGRELMPSRTNRREVKDLIDSGKKAGAFNDLSTLYPTARVEYNKLAKSNQLPSMKGERSEVGTTTSPLGGSAEEVDTPMGGVIPPAADVVLMSAPEQDKFRAKFRTHVTPMTWSGQVTYWDVSDVEAGNLSSAVKKAMIMRARVVVLLLSPEFLAHHRDVYRYVIEAYKAGVRVFPVLVNQSAWKETPLGALNPMPPESEGTISEMRSAQQDSAFVAIMVQLRKILAQPRQPSTAAQPANEGVTVHGDGNTIVVTRGS